ncbi:MAG TPA: hypothetical protein VHF69_13060, partial [Candidatus Synoicihabitans sp.]|nr:hypothetical protein [Candidatus Synoicihabitans sp.]
FTGLAAGQWGALRSVEQLQLIVGYGKALVFPERVFLPNIGERTSGGGSIVDVKNEERLEQQARNFVAFIQRVSTSLAPHGSTR